MPNSEQAHNEVQYLLNLERWVIVDRFGDKKAANELIDFTLNPRVLNGDDSGWKMHGLEHVISAVGNDPVVDRALGAMVVVAVADNETPARSASLTASNIVSAATHISKITQLYERWAKQYGPDSHYEDENREWEARANSVAALLNPLFRAAVSHFHEPLDRTDAEAWKRLDSADVVTNVISAMPAGKGQQAAALKVWADHLVSVAVDDPKTVAKLLLRTADNGSMAPKIADSCRLEADQFSHTKVGLRFLERYTGGVFNLDAAADSIASRADELHYSHQSFQIPDACQDALAAWERSHIKAELPAYDADGGTPVASTEALQAIMKRRAEPSPALNHGNGSY